MSDAVRDGSITPHYYVFVARAVLCICCAGGDERLYNYSQTETLTASTDSSQKIGHQDSPVSPLARLRVDLARDTTCKR